jgi:hypothetical protein
MVRPSGYANSRQGRPTLQSNLGNQISETHNHKNVSTVVLALLDCNFLNRSKSNLNSMSQACRLTAQRKNVPVRIGSTQYRNNQRTGGLKLLSPMRLKPKWQRYLHVGDEYTPYMPPPHPTSNQSVKNQIKDSYGPQLGR